MCDQRANLRRDTIPLVAHDDDGRKAPLSPPKGGRQGIGGREISQDIVHVFSLKERAEDIGDTPRPPLRGGDGFKPGGKINIMNAYARKRAHRGLYHLGVITIRCVKGTDDIVDPEPIASTDDRAQVPRVLNAIEGN